MWVSVYSLLSNASLSILQQYFNQILTTVLEVLDDSDSSTRELALSLITEMLNNQVRFSHFVNMNRIG